MQWKLAANGVWVEPASAAGLAGLAQRLKANCIDLVGKTVVAICTGHGLKDPEIVVRNMSAPRLIPVDLSVLEKEISGKK